MTFTGTYESPLGLLPSFALVAKKDGRRDLSDGKEQLILLELSNEHVGVQNGHVIGADEDEGQRYRILVGHEHHPSLTWASSS